MNKLSFNVVTYFILHIYRSYFVWFIIIYYRKQLKIKNNLYNIFLELIHGRINKDFQTFMRVVEDVKILMI